MKYTENHSQQYKNSFKEIHFPQPESYTWTQMAYLQAPVSSRIKIQGL